jgi:hypothetical protein
MSRNRLYIFIIIFVFFIKNIFSLAPVTHLNINELIKSSIDTIKTEISPTQLELLSGAKGPVFLFDNITLNNFVALLIKHDPAYSNPVKLGRFIIDCIFDGITDPKYEFSWKVPEDYNLADNQKAGVVSKKHSKRKFTTSFQQLFEQIYNTDVGNVQLARHITTTAFIFSSEGNEYFLNSIVFAPGKEGEERKIDSVAGGLFSVDCDTPSDNVRKELMEEKGLTKIKVQYILSTPRTAKNANQIRIIYFVLITNESEYDAALKNKGIQKFRGSNRDFGRLHLPDKIEETSSSTETPFRFSQYYRADEYQEVSYVLSLPIHVFQEIFNDLPDEEARAGLFAWGKDNFFYNSEVITAIMRHLSRIFPVDFEGRTSA